MITHMKSTTKSSNLFDRAGIFISSLCAVHCLLVPALLLLAPVVGSLSWIEGSMAHQVLFYSVFVTGVIAIYLGYRIHSDTKPMILLAIGLAIVFVGTFLAHDLFGHWSEYVINPIGGLFLIWAHYSNHTKRHLAQHKSCNTCVHTH